MLFRAQRQFSTPPRVDSHQKKQCSRTCAGICPHSQYMSDRQDCIRLLSKSVKRNYRKDCTVFPVIVFTGFIVLFGCQVAPGECKQRATVFFTLWSLWRHPFSTHEFVRAMKQHILETIPSSAKQPIVACGVSEFVFQMSGHCCVCAS